jgi:uncharacterized protein (DUF885 family)
MHFPKALPALTGLVLTMASCGDYAKKIPPVASGANDSLNNILEDYYEDKVWFFPVDATFNSDNRYNAKLNIDISEDFRKSADSMYARYQEQLAAIDTARLDDNHRLSYATLSRELSMGREGFTFHDHLMPIQQFSCLPLTLPQLGSGTSAQPFKTIKDYTDFISRMKSFAEWSDTAVSNMRRGIAEGYVWPQPLAAKVVPQLADLAKDDTAANIFFNPIRLIPADITGNDRSQLAKEYAAAVRTYILPSYKKLHTFFVKEYLPKARTTSGIDAVPDGKAYYAYLVKFWTTTTKTPEEIFALGEREVARIRSEMEAVKTETGFKGDLNAFFQFIRTDKQFKIFTTPEAVIDSFRAIETRIMPKVKTMYGHLPKTSFEVRQTEAFRAASASAEYIQGSADGTRPGIFYVPILKAEEFGYTGMETLFLHEAIPGHHFQISLQQENESLPKIRRFSWIGAYGEGYALYCESLGKELGLYTNPYMYFGHLSDEIHRAIRLVVDVAIHTKGWNRERAIKYMMDNEPVSEQEATAEIERYMAIPAQALSYKIGELKIRELRTRYELDTSFKLKEFHDELLKDGCLPLSVLEEKMNKRFRR